VIRRIGRIILAGLLFAGSVAVGEDKMQLQPDWEFVSDRVMGGVSEGAVRFETLDGHAAARLTGDVSLENDGGFVQMAFDLDDGRAFDASGWAGVELLVRGNGETYELRLRTTALTRPWQSFRAAFEAKPEWQHVRLPFADFEAHRTDAAFDPAQMRRLGVLAIGRRFKADVAVAEVALYR
jgi:hypothetical protein